MAGIGQVQHRPRPGRGRDRRGDQDGAGAAARPAAWPPCTPPSRPRTWTGPPGTSGCWPGRCPGPPGGRPRRAGVSSFGFSGTNAHAILEEAPAAAARPGCAGRPGARPGRGRVAWLVSARAAEGLAAQAGRLAQWVAARPELDPADVALVAGDHPVGVRAPRGGRWAAAGTSWRPGWRRWRRASRGGRGVRARSRRARARWCSCSPARARSGRGWARSWPRRCPVFAARLAECGAALAPHVDWDLSEVLAGADGAPGLDAVEVVQPALWAVMVSLAAAWQAAGVAPDAVVGHSQGEIAAATVAGILSLEDAARVVALRSRALARAGRAGRHAVGRRARRAVRDRIAPWGDRLSVAAVNGPAATVVVRGPRGAGGAGRRLRGRRGCGPGRSRWTTPRTAPRSRRSARRSWPPLAGITPAPGADPDDLGDDRGSGWPGRRLGAAYWYDSLRAPVEFEPGRPGPGRSRAPGVRRGLPAPGADRRDHRDRWKTAGGRRRRRAARGDRDAAPRRRRPGPVPGRAGRGARPRGDGRLGRGPGPRPAGGTAHLRVPAPAVLAASRAPAPPRRGDGAAPAAEAQFWAAVEGGDVAGLAAALAVDEQSGWARCCPALASWRRRERGESAVAGWRYRVSWGRCAGRRGGGAVRDVAGGGPGRAGGRGPARGGACGRWPPTAPGWWCCRPARARRPRGAGGPDRPAWPGRAAMPARRSRGGVAAGAGRAAARGVARRCRGVWPATLALVQALGDAAVRGAAVGADPGRGGGRGGDAGPARCRRRCGAWAWWRGWSTRTGGAA